MRVLNATIVAAALLAWPLAGAAQSTALASRAALQEELARLEQGGNAAAAAIIRARLEHGDFQEGDRIFVAVQGEEQLTDTFTVGAGLDLLLPQVGSVSVRGVLRSELQDRVQTHIAQYLRDPVVTARPLLRLLVEGQVARPGFYGIAPEQPLADVLEAAGGLTQLAKVKDMRVERGGTSIWSGTLLQEALARGYSVDRLNLRAGDRLFVPSRGDSERTLRILGLILTVPATVYGLTRIF